MIGGFGENWIEGAFLLVFGEVGNHNLFYRIGDFLDFLFRGIGFSSDDDVHVDSAGLGIGGCLLDGNFHQLNGFIDVSLCH